MFQRCDQFTVQFSSAAKRRLASWASRYIWARTLASRSRWSSVTSQRPTTAVTIPGNVFTLPMVQTASSCFLSMKRDDVPFHAFRAQHNTQWQAHALKHRSLLDVQFEICGGVLLFFLGIREFVDLHAATPQRVFQFHTVAIGAA